jgi:hypothetical protein
MLFGRKPIDQLQFRIKTAGVSEQKAQAFFYNTLTK